MGWKLQSAVVVSIFRDLNDTKIKKDGISQKELQEIYGNLNLIKLANIYPQDTAQNDTIVPNTRPMINKKTIIIAAVILLIVGVGALVASHSVSLPSMPSFLKPSPTPTPTPRPSPTPTPVPTEQDKAKLSVDIQNGTGTPGQAAKVKARIAKLDYKDIKAGNGKTEDNITTQVLFTPRVPKEYRDEIVEDLKKIFSDVNDKEDPSGSSDITIITGKEN